MTPRPRSRSCGGIIGSTNAGLPAPPFAGSEFLEIEQSLEEVPDELRLHEKTVAGTNIHKEVRQDFGDVDGASKVRHARSVGADLAASLPDDARLAVVEGNPTGGAVAPLRYALNRREAIVAKIRDQGADGILAALEQGSASHAWVNGANAEIERALNLALPRDASHLVVRDGREWTLLRSWPQDRPT